MNRLFSVALIIHYLTDLHLFRFLKNPYPSQTKEHSLLTFICYCFFQRRYPALRQVRAVIGEPDATLRPSGVPNSPPGARRAALRPAAPRRAHVHRHLPTRGGFCGTGCARRARWAPVRDQGNPPATRRADAHAPNAAALNFLKLGPRSMGRDRMRS